MCVRNIHRFLESIGKGHNVLCLSPCSKKVVTESGGVTVGVERVNGTQLTATVQYATVEFSGNTTIGQLTVEPAQFGVHYTGTAGSLTFETSAVRSMHQQIYPYNLACNFM